MTLIVTTQNSGVPIMIGDILVSSKTENKGISLPNFFEGLNDQILSQSISFPSSLRQKIYILNNQLCLGLTGRMDQVFSFLNYFQAFFSTEEYRIEDLQGHLDTYPKEKKTELAGIFLSVRKLENNRSEIIAIKVGGCEEKVISPFGKTIACGSGKKQFLEFLKSSDYLEKSGFDELGKALYSNLTSIAAQLGNEAALANTITEAWGAGFEMIYYWNGKFQKLDQFTIFMFTGEFSLEGKLKSGLNKCMKFQQENDELMGIRVIHGNGEKMNFGIPPLNKDPSDYLNVKVTDPKFDSAHTIASYVIKMPNGKIYSPAFYTGSSQYKEKNPQLIMIDGDQILISQKFSEIVEKIVHEHFNKEG